MQHRRALLPAGRRGSVAAVRHRRLLQSGPDAAAVDLRRARERDVQRPGQRHPRRRGETHRRPAESQKTHGRPELLPQEIQALKEETPNLRKASTQEVQRQSSEEPPPQPEDLLMRATKRIAETHSTQKTTGLFATLRALSGAKGTRAPSSPSSDGTRARSLRSEERRVGKLRR